MVSLACNTSHSVFRGILRWIGHSHRTKPFDELKEQREEMKKPSAYASACVPVARSTRRHTPTIARCTNDALVASVVMGFPRPGPYLDMPDSSCIMDAIYITMSVDGIPETVNPRSSSDSAQIQKRTPTLLPEGSDYCLEWSVPYFNFSCIASRRPGDTSDTRHVTYVIIHTLFADSMGPDRFHVSLRSVPWDALLGAIQKLPDLQGIAVHNQMMGRDSHILLKKFATHLRQLWGGIDNLLEVRENHLIDDVWTTVELDKVTRSSSETSDEGISSSTACDTED